MSKAMRLRAFLNKRNTIFHPVVRFDPAVQKLISIDLTSTNNSLTEEIYSDIERFNKFIAEHISIHNATYAIGGYDELRVVYNRSQVFDAKAAGEEPRRRHLGIDIWGESQTPVFCPYTGIVHSTGFNNNDGDYGATIILAPVIYNSQFIVPTNSVSCVVN